MARRIQEKSKRQARQLKRTSVKALRARISKLKADPPVRQPGVWYRTQKEHWLGWLGEYDTEGAYGRIPGMNRDARFAYNHIVCPGMLYWLAKASGVDGKARLAGERAGKNLATLGGQAGAFRRHVSWEVVEQALWPPRKSES